MSRGLTANQQAEVQADHATREWLIELEYYDPQAAVSSFRRLTTAAQDIDYDVDGTGAVTFEGTGGFLDFEGIPENVDLSGQQTRMSLSAVDPAIGTDIDTMEFRGRDVRVWSAQIKDDGTLDVVGPFIFSQLGDYEITIDWGDGDSPGSAEISTTVESVLAGLAGTKPIRCSVSSHHALLRRAGLAATSTYFRNVPAIAGAEIHLGATGGHTRSSDPGSGPGEVQVY